MQCLAKDLMSINFEASAGTAAKLQGDGGMAGRQDGGVAGWEGRMGRWQSGKAG